MVKVVHLSTFQILVVGLRGVAHGLDRLVVDVKAEGDALVVHRLGLPSAIHVHCLFALHVPVLMVDDSLRRMESLISYN